MKIRGCLYRLGQALLILILLAAAGVYFYFILPFWGYPFNGQRHTRVPVTPPWALECWLWEDDVNTGEYVMQLLEGYARHDIPVRTIMIDSPWSTRYNDFIVDENRYPKPAEFFQNLQDKGYRVVLWMTSMVNSHSKDTAIRESQDWFEEAKRKGYLAGDGAASRWWKGTGGFIDYTNPEAMFWWRGLQQQMFDWGIDGWKLDGTDTLFFGRLGPLIMPYQKTFRGWMTTRGYMDLYAREEYRHGLSQNPEFITLVRSIDRPFTHPEGFAPLDAAPVTWVGDKAHTWGMVDAGGNDTPLTDRLFNLDQDEGLEGALRDILLSAKIGYCVVGCDIPGYLGGHIPANLYIRWAQFGAFTGLFLNGGHGNRELWNRSPDELEIVRKFAWLHTELVPYMYSHVIRCHEGGPPLMRPVSGKYHYLFGDDFLVAPIYRDSLNHTVTFPKGRWRYLFNDRDIIDGPATITRDFPLAEFSVYVRDGAVVPMNVTRDYTGFGNRDSQGYLTLNIYPAGISEFPIHHTDGSGLTTVRVAETGDKIEVVFTGVQKPHILRMLRAQKPARVALDGKSLTEGTAWRYDVQDQRLWIKTATYKDGRYLIQN